MKIPLSLYIHIPWCIKKCPYCDFYSVPIKKQGMEEDRYVKALISDLEKDLIKFGIEERFLTSIFIGGGTPSLLRASSIEYLLNEINKRLKFDKDIEITLEVNPETVDQNSFSDFRKAQINRLSIGIQSFQNDKLQKLQRVHDSYKARKAVEIARISGFDNFNLDLMYGLPNQSIKDAIYDLKTAIEFAPTHISWYQLTLEKNTPFGICPPKEIPDEDILFDMQIEGQILLKQSLYYQYEVSAYSKTNFECRHNLNYWQFGDYLSIGASAHGKITSNQCITRYYKTSNIKSYILQNSDITKYNVLSKKEIILEFMMNVLRLVGGVPTSLFEERTGIDLKEINYFLEKWRKNGFLVSDTSVIQTTNLGRNFLDTCLEDLV